MYQHSKHIEIKYLALAGLKKIAAAGIVVHHTKGVFWWSGAGWVGHCVLELCKDLCQSEIENNLTVLIYFCINQRP